MILTAVGFASRCHERSFDTLELKGGRGAIDRILQGHELDLVLAANRNWTRLSANKGNRRTHSRGNSSSGRGTAQCLAIDDPVVGSEASTLKSLERGLGFRPNSAITATKST